MKNERLRLTSAAVRAGFVLACVALAGCSTGVSSNSSDGDRLEVLGGIPEAGVTFSEKRILVSSEAHDDIPTEVEDFFRQAGFMPNGKVGLLTARSTWSGEYRGGPGPWDVVWSVFDDFWEMTFAGVGDPLANFAAKEWAKQKIEEAGRERSDHVIVAAESAFCFPIDDATLGVIDVCKEGDGSISISAGEGVIVGVDWNPETGDVTVQTSAGYAIRIVGVQHSADVGLGISVAEDGTKVGVGAGGGLSEARVQLVTRQQVYDFTLYSPSSPIWDGNFEVARSGCEGDLVGTYAGADSGDVSATLAPDGEFFGSFQSSGGGPPIFLTGTISERGVISGETDNGLSISGHVNFDSCATVTGEWEFGTWTMRGN